jgi:hypothetical protein
MYRAVITGLLRCGLFACKCTPNRLCKQTTAATDGWPAAANAAGIAIGAVAAETMQHSRSLQAKFMRVADDFIVILPVCPQQWAVQ